MVIQNKIFSSEIKRQAKNVFFSDVEKTVGEMLLLSTYMYIICFHGEIKKMLY